ncbi:hypothetical protein GGI25_001634 [Coemansia spiralis]|uniref:Uncharacterized protein n=2 Tax=Coemansia TaxID=4863 RepID=A0A9W8KZA4_9FUNG|nr:hypothetical protein BX070DRAFT_61587 [Coemansia spiralis]KAJ1991573.1 hypothetical protein EDC05_003338 [Coemansia umbellata]KAJ2623934.1 hypothetical protein GGI26_001949 [Coemansia sp. RSA 1358]KAJ2679278.1 hypothetical protein GGI25_001634 [Coemansia spiralis]
MQPLIQPLEYKKHDKENHLSSFQKKKETHLSQAGSQILYSLCFYPAIIHRSRRKHRSMHQMQPQSQKAHGSSRHYFTVGYKPAAAAPSGNLMFVHPTRSASPHVIHPTHRNAGIGGYSTDYKHSGIGGNSSEWREMGIGKACLSTTK